MRGEQTVPTMILYEREKLKMSNFNCAVHVLEGLSIPTAGGRSSFYAKVVEGGVDYILGNGKTRNQTDAYTDRLFKKFCQTGSLRTSDYPETRHASYFLGVIKKVLKLDTNLDCICDENDPDRFIKTIQRVECDQRIGQQIFKKKLIEYWKGSSIGEVLDKKYLVASHIKPWSKSTSWERLDLYNGLLLTPNLDKAFDCGDISFDDTGKIIISDKLSGYTDILGINASIRLVQIRDEHRRYLNYHQKMHNILY